MRCKTRRASRTEWAELLEQSGVDYALSETYEFGEALARAYGEYSYQPRLFEFADGVCIALPLIKVKRRPGFLRCYEAMPVSLSGAPISVIGDLTSDHWQAALVSLEADSIYVNAGSRRGLPAGSWTESGEFVSQDCVTHVLGLSQGFGQIWTGSFSGKVRNQCRAAERKGVEVHTADRLEDFEAYYSIYVSSTERWGYGAPPYPMTLFQSLAGLAGKGVELKLARIEGRAVAGILLFHGRRSTLYWSGAMLKEFGSYNPNNALLRSAIEEACSRGEAAFDFGGSGALHSVQAFKESFGARPMSYQNVVFTTSRYRLMTRARTALAHVGI